MQQAAILVQGEREAVVASVLYGNCHLQDHKMVSAIVACTMAGWSSGDGYGSRNLQLQEYTVGEKRSAGTGEGTYF